MHQPTDRIAHTSCGTLTGMRNSSKGPSRGIDPMTHHTMIEHSTTELRPTVPEELT